MIYRVFKKLVRKESNFLAIMLCIAGVLLNLVLNLLVTAFELPLYLDTVGTVAGAGIKKISGIVGMILLFTFIGGGVGAFIPFFLNGLVFDAESLFGVLYNTGFFSVESSYFLSSLIMELPLCGAFRFRMKK